MIENEMEGYRPDLGAVLESEAHTVVHINSAGSPNPAGRTRLELHHLGSSHTGWGRSSHGPFRGVHDDRYGTPARSDELVEDGFKDNIWVHSWDVDPDDPFEVDRPTNPLEGIVDNKPVR